MYMIQGFEQGATSTVANNFVQTFVARAVAGQRVYIFTPPDVNRFDLTYTTTGAQLFASATGGLSFGNAISNVTFAANTEGTVTVTLPSTYDPSVDAGVGSAFYISITATLRTANTGAVPTLYPADRCTWQTAAVGGTAMGYSIGNVSFYGLGATATTVSVASLGYIGKSGRFVEIAR